MARARSLSEFQKGAKTRRASPAGRPCGARATPFPYVRRAEREPPIASGPPLPGSPPGAPRAPAPLGPPMRPPSLPPPRPQPRQGRQAAGLFSGGSWPGASRATCRSIAPCTNDAVWPCYRAIGLHRAMHSDGCPRSTVRARLAARDQAPRLPPHGVPARERGKATEKAHARV